MLGDVCTVPYDSVASYLHVVQNFRKKTNGHFTEKRNAGCLSMCGNHLSEPKVGAYQLAYAPVQSGNDLPIIMIGAYQFVSIFVLTDKNGMYLPVLLVRSYHFCDTYLLLYILKNMVGAFLNNGMCLTCRELS